MQPAVADDPCRCGWSSTSGETHWCHRCHKRPGTPVWVLSFPALAGVHMKAQLYVTVACPICLGAYHEAQRKLLESVA